MEPGKSLGPVRCGNSMDAHLTYGDVRSISYAIETGACLTLMEVAGSLLHAFELMGN